MTIITKFASGDSVWLMHENKPGEYEIEEITIKIGSINIVHAVSIEHKIRVGGIVGWYGESQIFTTKELLLQSL